MRPENKWNSRPPKDKRKRKPKPKVKVIRERLQTTTRSQTRQLACKGTEPMEYTSVSDGPSPAGHDGVSPDAETSQNNQKMSNTVAGDSAQARENNAVSAEQTNKVDSWQQEDPIAALKRAIQSSPARNMNMDVNHMQFSEERLTPKPVRRALFTSKDGTAMKTLGNAFLNGMQRSPRANPRSKSALPGKENNPPAANENDGLGGTFAAANETDQAADLPVSPTPKRTSPCGERAPLSPSRTLGLSPRASRIDQLAKCFSPSPKKNQGIPEFDGLNLNFNIFDSELDLGNQYDSNLFSPSMLQATDDFAEWLQTEGAPMSDVPDGEESEQRRPNTSASGATTLKDLTSPAFTQRDVDTDEEKFRALLREAVGQPSGTTGNSDLFNNHEVDPQLAGFWSNEGSGNGGPVAGIDEAVFADMVHDLGNKANNGA